MNGKNTYEHNVNLYLNTHVQTNHNQKRLIDGEIVTNTETETMTSPTIRNNIVQKVCKEDETVTNILMETETSNTTKKYMPQTSHIGVGNVNKSKIYQEIG